MRFLSLAIMFSVLLLSPAAKAQMAASKEAAYLATITAVSAYKINDEENLKNVEKLRQDKRFNEKLQKMLSQLSNNRTKNTKNKKVLQILEDAGKEIYDLLK